MKTIYLCLKCFWKTYGSDFPSIAAGRTRCDCCGKWEDCVL